MKYKAFIYILFIFSYLCGIQKSNAANEDFHIESNNKIEYNLAKNKATSFFSGWSLAFNYGATQFIGDIRQYDHYPAFQQENNFFELKTALALQVSKSINPFLILQSEFISGNFAGLKRRNSYTNLTPHDPYINYEGSGEKFVAEFFEIDFNILINLTETANYFSNRKSSKKLSVYAKLGTGYNIFRTLKTNLFSDSYIYSYGYINEGANINGDLHGTEKSNFFDSPTETVYVLGIVSKYKINQKLSLNFEYALRTGRTDKWDASVIHTTNANDRYNYLAIGLEYNFNKPKQDKDWISPIDNLETNVSNLNIEIEGLADDSDGDGVSDAFDKSPNTPLGVSVDGSGRPLDVDFDNVPDYKDFDPFSTRGAEVNDYGVEIDSDKDGIPDSKDLELNTKKGAIVNQFGVRTFNHSDKSLLAFPSIYFLSGSSKISFSNEKRLATIAILMKNNPRVRFRVVGHTDSFGDEKSNKDLGFLRAKAVISHLAQSYQINLERFEAETKGETEPLTELLDEKKVEGKVINQLHSINRRVDFELIH